MNPDLVAKSLSYHGQPLQKIWDGERGSHDLYKLGLTSPDFSVYAGRQKTLSFQDRAKRLKLHQFIARKASILFDSALANDVNIKKKDRTALCMKIVMPPYETFLSRNIDKSKQTQHVLGAIQPGDIVYGTILSRSPSGLLIKVICTGEPVVRYLADISIKAVVLAQNLVPAHDKKGNPKPYMTNDYVCCEVLDISVDADRMSLGMKGTLTIDPKAPLGSITSDQLPEYYKRLIENPEASYDELLEKSKGFENPNCVENLFQDLGLDINDTFSNMTSLKGRFPSQEYATELRQIQASKWAFRSVADGIEHFKVGRHSEAFQCLNKALSIDPRNVEGLVARGALYANSGSFKKAVEDFETALKLNPYHANARKYMGETLVALGRSYEEENRIDDARKAYTDCLNIIPHHEEAKSSLEFLNGKSGQVKQLIDTSELLPALKIPTDIKKDPEIVAKKHEESKKDKNFKKKKIKNRKRKGSTSSSSSEDSSGSSDSSSSSESSSSDSSSSSSDSETEKPKKKTRSGKSKQKSLSPISKRMALMDEQHPASGTTRYQFNQPFHLASSTNPTTATTGDDYDAKVRNFLEMTRDEDDYELRVRKLVEDASKHRKERKVDEKSKKKDKKKQKKVKKESKRDKKKKEKSKEKAELENMDLKEALKIFKSLPMLDIGSKLSTDLAKYEKSIEMLQKRRDVPSTSREVEPIVKKKSISPPPIPAARKPETPPKLPPSVKEKPKTPELVRTLPPKPPIFLDKFGCFRLAVPEEPKVALPTRRSPSPQRHRYSRSRSRSRHGRRSRSRSSRRSRSPRRSRSARRSRSPRRSRSRRRSRSGRRSRSRSVRRSRSAQRSRSRSGRRSPSVRRSYSRRSRSFSRRRMRSRSRSPVRRSPSPFVRRSRSYSVERRFRSRSRGSRRSHSYSRSRSRSPLPWRRGRRGGFRGSRGFGFRGRGRGRGRGGFRGGRRSPFVRDRSYDDSPRSRRSEEPSFKKKNRTRDSPSIEEKWTHDKYEKTTTNNDGAKSPSVKDEENWDDEPKKDTGNGAVEDTREGSTSSTGARHKSEPSPEEIDKMINQAQKDRKEEILQRDKNLLKKPTPTNLPF